MRRPGGHFITSTCEGEDVVDTFTCGHCQTIVAVQPKQRPEDIGGLCKQCMHLVCPVCVAKMTCTPWEEQLKRMEARDRLYQDMRQA